MSCSRGKASIDHRVSQVTPLDVVLVVDLSAESLCLLLLCGFFTPPAASRGVSKTHSRHLASAVYHHLLLFTPTSDYTSDYRTVRLPHNTASNSGVVERVLSAQVTALLRGCHYICVMRSEVQSSLRKRREPPHTTSTVHTAEKRRCMSCAPARPRTERVLDIVPLATSSHV